MGIIVKHARFLITLDKTRRILRDGAVACEGDRIVAVGKTDEVLKDYPSMEFSVEAKDGVVLPGLIDGHCHTNQQLMRGLTDDIYQHTAVHGRMWPFEASLTEEDVHLSAVACCLEAIKSGTTCFADPGGYHMEKVVEAVDQTGMRAILARSLIDLSTPATKAPEALRESTDKAVKEGEEFVRRYDGAAESRIKTWFSLRTERSTSNELAKRIKELADRYGTGIQSHMATSQQSIRAHKEIFEGKRPLERYEEMGILGPNLLIIHANWVNEQELEALKRNDVKVVHCPIAGFHRAVGTLHGSFVEMEKMGITVCLGHDHAHGSPLDMPKLMNAVKAHKDIREDPTIYPPETILEMATINGAKALLMEDEIGSLEVGKKADITIFNVKRPEWVPVLNPVSNLVGSACGHSADTVIIEGKVVLEKGKTVTINEEDILEKAQETAEEIARRSGLIGYAQPRWPLL